MDLTRKEIIKIIATPKRNDKFYTTNFDGLDLEGLDLSNLTLTRCDFNRANLSRVNFCKTRLNRVSFLETNLLDVVWKNTHLNDVIFCASEINFSSLKKFSGKQRFAQSGNGRIFYINSLQLSPKDITDLKLFDTASFEQGKKRNAVKRIIISGTFGYMNKLSLKESLKTPNLPNHPIT